MNSKKLKKKTIICYEKYQTEKTGEKTIVRISGKLSPSLQVYRLRIYLKFVKNIIY